MTSTPNGRMTGKVVAITGAASGIGLGTVELLLAEGAMVVAGDIQDAKGAMLARRFPDTLAYVHCDVTSEDDIATLMATAEARFGGLDGLFNNAGAGGVMTPVEMTDTAAFRASMELLVTSVFMGTKHAVPLMERRGGGAIVNTASIAGLQAGFGPLAYSTAKAAVIHFSRAAAAELAAKQIRVNAVCPGLIATSIIGASLGMPVAQADQMAAMLASTGGAAQPVHRAGLPEDIAQMVLLLMSDAGSFINGAHMVVDGGITVGGKHAWDPTTPSPFIDALGLDPEQAQALIEAQMSAQMAAPGTTG